MCNKLISVMLVLFAALGAVDAQSQQISPNPNSGTILITSQGAINNQVFENGLSGLIQISGGDLLNNSVINNYGDFDIYSGTLVGGGIQVNQFFIPSDFNNYGNFDNRGGVFFQKINNYAQLENHNQLEGSVYNHSTATMQNSGWWESGSSPGGVLTNEGNLVNNGYLVTGNSGFIKNYGQLTNSGDIRISSYNDGSLENYGDLKNTGLLSFDFDHHGTNSGLINNLGGSIEINHDSSLINNSNGVIQNNNGQITVGWDGIFSNSGVMVNSGTINNTPNLAYWLNQGVYDAGFGSTVNSGTLINNGIILTSKDCYMSGCASSVLSNSGVLINNNAIDNGGIFNNAGVFHGAGNVNNSGLIANDGQFFNLGVLTNVGQFSNRAILSNDGQITNTGNFIVGNLIGSGVYNQNSGTTTINGSLTQGVLNLNGGLLEGAGDSSIYSLVSVSGGTFKPTDVNHQLSIFNDLEFTGGVLDTQIDQTGNDLLYVSGAVSFSNNTLKFSFKNGPLNTTTLANNWRFLTAEGEILGWQNINLVFDGTPEGYSGFITREGNSLVLNNTPIPSTIWLLISGLGGLCLVSRKSKA